MLVEDPVSRLQDSRPGPRNHQACRKVHRFLQCQGRSRILPHEGPHGRDQELQRDAIQHHGIREVLE